MIVKEIRDEDFTSYKKPAMVIGFPRCSWKCEKECGERVCQNSALAQSPDIEVKYSDIIQRYIENKITSAVIIGGLEPFDTYLQLIEFIELFRNKTNDDIVIYTGYCKNEINKFINNLSQFKNIIVKYGRFIPGHKPHYDEVLGVKLASDNQYAEVIS